MFLAYSIQIKLTPDFLYSLNDAFHSGVVARTCSLLGSLWQTTH
jgi:hypothetical protein